LSLISLRFVLFVLITFLAYFLFPKKYKWTVLLVASYAYYFLNCNKYVIYLVVTTVTTFLGGLIIEKMAQKSSCTLKSHKEDWSKEERKAFKNKALKQKKLMLALVLVINFGILAFLKYFGFLATSINAGLSAVGLSAQLPYFKLVLPLGISFYTFQAMGYLIDIYRGKFAAERNIAKFALFVSFFPQIIQGPIAFYSDLAHQLYEPHKFNYDKFKSGSLLIIWGVFKKIVIADRAVKMVNLVTHDYEKFSGTYILLAALMYSLQLYADFSGGIDVCRGIAEILGIEMAQNFKRPYFSKSLTEYWHRWHITLGAWLRTYLFYPISISKAFLNFGKSLKKKTNRHIGKVLPTSIASLITFIVIGIWHGANWKYVAFGLWNGIMIMLAELCRPFLDKLTEKLRIDKNNFFYRVFAMIRTFILVLIGYYFDIAKNFTSAIKMLWLSVSDVHWANFFNYSCLLPSKLDRLDYLVIIAGAIVMFVLSVIQEKNGKSIRELLYNKSLGLQWTLYIILILVTLVFGYYGPGTSPSDFVYMQF
jgi:alginate O-acetyltransferase complex protein AlgI